MKSILILSALLLAPALSRGAPSIAPREDARRLEVLFLGAPTSNHPAHDPVERYRVVRKHLGVDGINFTYTESLDDLRPEVLNRFDSLMLYGNWSTLSKDQEKALVDYVESGHGFLPIHCASACFEKSDAYGKLVGGHFKSHGTAVFRTKIVEPQHPIMKGYKDFETWDETYVHDRLTSDRTLLQQREEEPWTWVRTQGKGRIFYTAYGHDMRCWDQPEFNDLLRRGILWSVNDATRAKLYALKLPKLETEPMELPGYKQRKLITEGQKPLSPEESMKLAQVPNGFELSLFASEPDIINPIYVNWDERGRAFVVQTVDYPNNLQAKNLGHDSIKICEDTNGDGKADKFTVFADKLSIPTSLTFANGGVICTNATEMLFLKDTDGDDKADVRQVLFSGFNPGDTHAGVSNLRYGLDNWVYATIGYSGFEGDVGGERKKFSTGVFRFRPDGSKLEFLQNTTNNTWGLGFTSDFDIIGSTANGNPSWYVTYPKEAYASAGLDQPKTPRADNNPLFFPISMDIRQVDQFDRYTAGAGHAFVTSTRMPESYRDKMAFVCEPSGKLVGSFEVSRAGSGFVARQSPNNLYSSADAWSGPVCAEEGPDGAVWICDWYNLIIQHNPTPSKASAGLDAKNGKGNAYETPVRDTKLGRIYRVYPKGSKNEAEPKLDIKTPASLVSALKHPNLFWRLQAQRLIVENQIKSLAPALKEIVTSNGPGALQAYQSLNGLGALDDDAAKAALTSSSRGLRRAAISAASGTALADSTLRDGVIQAADARELGEILVAFAKVQPSDQIGSAILATLEARRADISKDAALRDAWQIAARRHAVPILVSAATKPADSTAKPIAKPNLLPNPDFSGKAGEAPSDWSPRVYGGKKDDVEMILADGGRNGGTCLKITAKGPVDAGAGAEIAVKPNTRYLLSGWIKADNLQPRGGMGALFNIHGKEPKTQATNGNRDWTQFQIEFNTDNDQEILIHCLFGGYGAAVGTAFFDDVSLTEIGDASPTDVITPLASFLASKGTPEQKKAVVDAFAKRNDDFGKSIIATIGAAPSVETPMVRKFKPDPAVHKRGAEVYARTCIACHGPDGKGVPGAFPPLDGAEWPVGDVTIPIRILLAGLQGPIEVKGQKFQNVMPPHVDLKDEEIADVLTYVRQSWSNDAASVEAATVKKVRADNAARKTPWTADELKPH
jgi:uncharacterized protein